MIIFKNKGFQTNSLYPNSDWAGIADFVVPDDSEIAQKIQALYPYYDFALDGDGNLIDVVETERPPEPQPIPSEQRESAYSTLTHKEDGTPLITWEGQNITVNKASEKWLYYSSEGSETANELSAIIVEAKSYIRELYPD